MIKRETTKAINAVVSFVLIFIVSLGFIAYAPSYVAKINEFSSDVSTAALDLGTDIIMPDSNTSGSDSTDLIRDALFGIQVRQPWLLLQFGTTDISSLDNGTSRVETLLSTSPDTNNGKDRESVVKTELETYGNINMSVNKVTARLGMVLLLLIVNIAISIFVILLAGLMLFSQILFIMYATMLPFCLLLSMIPTFNGLAKRGVEKVFNAIMLRAGYTVIITAAFSISSMLYSLSGSMPLLFVAFLQIAVFAGIYFKQNELLSMISLQGNDNQGMTRRMWMGTRRMNSAARRMERSVKRSTGGGVMNTIRRTFSGSGGGSGNNRSNNGSPGSGRGSGSNRNHNNSFDNDHNGGDSAGTGSGTVGQSRPNKTNGTQQSFGERFGQAVENGTDFPPRAADGADSVEQRVTDAPTHTRYTVQQGKDSVSSAVQHSKERVTDNIQDFGLPVSRTQAGNQARRTEKQDRETVAMKKERIQSGAKGRNNVSVGSGGAGKYGVDDSDKQRTDKSAAKRTGISERGNISAGSGVSGNNGAVVSDKPMMDNAVVKHHPHDRANERGNIPAGFGKPINRQQYQAQPSEKSGPTATTGASGGERPSDHNRNKPYLANGILKSKKDMEYFTGIEKRTSIGKQKNSVSTSKKSTEKKRRG